MITNSPIILTSLPVKTLVRKYVLLIVLSIISLSLSAQGNQPGTASAVATATIVTELVGTYGFDDLTFDSTGKCHPGVTINAATVINGTASFNIIGDYAYSITIPEKEILVINKERLDSMHLGSFCFTRGEDNSIANEQRILINADLNVKALQSPGNYSPESPLVVTVNYN